MKIVLYKKKLYQVNKNFACKKDKKNYAELLSPKGEKAYCFPINYRVNFGLHEVPHTEIFPEMRIACGSRKGKIEKIIMDGIWPKAYIKYDNGETYTEYIAYLTSAKVIAWK